MILDVDKLMGQPLRKFSFKKKFPCDQIFISYFQCKERDGERDPWWEQNIESDIIFFLSKQSSLK
jgi:hypothetical protein